MLSHRDTDHVGGAASLLAGVRVLASTSSLADDHPLRARLPAHRRCDAGQRWAWDGVQFEVLHPSPQDHAVQLKSNALSCVLMVTAADGRRLLLTGDIEAAQEAALLARSGEALRSEVLLVPHHGSRTSSTPAFLDAVSPRVAVVQAAYRSRFGHPAPDVLARYAERRITVLRSDRCGAWAWPAPGESGTDGTCERQARARYWHHAAGAPGVFPE
jgi:competence protein ComEC